MIGTSGACSGSNQIHMRIGWMLVVPACLAQASAQTTAPVRPTPYAALSGVVLNDATGAPIRRAAITLSTLDDTPLEALTFSESNGAFGFTAIPPGKYQLRVDLEGFQQARFGAGTSNRPPATLKLASGDVRYGITFRLRPLGSISGVVFDPEGDPFPNVPVRLLKSGWQRLKPSWQDVMSSSSDDRGRYRFQDVVPGEYVVMASRQYDYVVSAQSEATAGESLPWFVYAVQFYPDAARLSAASPVQLTSGQDLEDIDFHLTTRPASPLRGKVVLFGGPAADQYVEIQAFPQDLPGGNTQTGAAVASPPNHTFGIPILSAGPYVIVASITVAGREYRDVERIDLPPGGQEIVLHPLPSIDLSGRVDQEGAAGPPSEPFRVSLVPGGFPPSRRRIDVEARPDGSFTVPNVVPGIWDIDVTPVPPGGYIKAMRLGNQDVLTEDMTIDSGTHDSLRLVVSARGGVVAGTVTVPPGVVRSQRADILLAPCGKYAHVLSFYAQAASDDAGHFEIKGVTPGRYKLYAFEEMDSLAYGDPGFLKPFAGLSEAFDVAEGERVERQTQLILSGTEGPERR